ncbi:tripartite tricarboxylate transporter substrate binding protein [Paenibacillus polymyxa]|uniref:tripartite tricarboxylate transporter substrate binding protein n=1 Tax=Paenibacillus TaxID=44249 RepID=UPI0020251E6E|nr:tripartite tricarboxylate transporter substrate binding protein [Paenibacillus polymyxa]URJ38195.1 tripartite tricarboxylate transporter substrate binding protein [Paenibacillus polymyxa]
MKKKPWQKYVLVAAGVAMLSALSISEYVDHHTLQDHSRIFPTKPITLVVPYAAGGGTDITARALAKAAEKHLGQPIIVVNRTGGGGSVGLMEGAEAQADGYTVTYLVAELTTLPHLGLLPLTYERFKPLLQTNMDPSAITVRADAPWKTAEAFLEDAGAHPGKLKMGNAGTGSIWHLAAAMLEQKSGVRFTHIPYEGAGPAVSALMSGFVDAVPVSPAEVKKYVDEGKLRILAIQADTISEAFPKVPTLQQSTGLRVHFIGTWRGLAVPKDTPDEVAQTLTDALIKGTKDGEFREEMRKHGLGLRVQDAEAFARQLKESHDTFARLIPELGLSRK